MSVSASKTDLIQVLETALDNNEEYIGVKVWQDLSHAYDELNKGIEELEEVNRDLNSTIEHLEEQIENLESTIGELQGGSE